jgi:hypothetical protein
MEIDEQKLVRLSQLSGWPIDMIKQSLNRRPSKTEELMKTATEIGEIRSVAENSDPDPHSASARIAACKRWLELEPGNELATGILSMVTTSINLSLELAKRAPTPQAAMEVYTNAPEGSAAEKAAIERALSLI